MRKILRKKFDYCRDEVEPLLYNMAANVYYFTIKNEKLIVEMCLRFPTEYCSYCLYHCRNTKEIDNLLDNYQHIVIGQYMEIFTMTKEEIFDDILIFDTFVQKYQVGFLQGETLYWSKETGQHERYSDAMLEGLEKIINNSGVYKLFDENRNLIYIGKSYKLGRRILGSGKDKKAKYYSYSIINNKADTDIYEVYYISKLKPPLNGTNVTKDSPTIILRDIEFSQLKKFA